MDAERLFEPKTQIYQAEVFTHLFSLETVRALRYQELFSLFLIELDHTADFHLRESQISEISQIISHNLRNELRGTDLIGQMGKGIGIILLHAGEEELQGIAERIQRRVEYFAFPPHLSGPSRRVTISIGVACFPQNGVTDSTLLTNARLGLEEAKRQGGNCFVILGGRRKDPSSSGPIG